VASVAVANDGRSFLPWVFSPFETCLAPWVSGLSSGSDPASRAARRDPKISTAAFAAAAGSRLSDAGLHDLAVAGLPGVFDVKERLDLGIGFARKLD
jgi:hypothetical protein